MSLCLWSERSEVDHQVSSSSALSQGLLLSPELSVWRDYITSRHQGSIHSSGSRFMSSHLCGRHCTSQAISPVPGFFLFVCFVFPETGSYIAQTGSNLMILLSQFPQCWNCGCDTKPTWKFYLTALFYLMCLSAGEWAPTLTHTWQVLYDILHKCRIFKKLKERWEMIQHVEWLLRKPKTLHVDVQYPHF